MAGAMTSGNFLDLDQQHSSFDRARVLVLPLALKATVSYGGGAARGPAAIIEASQQVELYDREHDDEPALRYGLHTLDAPQLHDDDPEAAVARSPPLSLGLHQAARSWLRWAASTP